MTTHSERMKEHLISQFGDKPVIYAELDALGAELDEIHKAFDDLKNKRWIATGEGVQLDNIGTIVDRARKIDDAIQTDFFGFRDQDNAQTFDVGRFRGDSETWLKTVWLDDGRYRKILWLKIFKDCSICTIDDMLHSLSVLFDVDHITLSEIGNADVLLGIGKRLTANEIRFMTSIELLVRGGGIGINAIEMYNYDNCFGFLEQPNIKGFEVGEFADIAYIGG